ncbi:Dyp-type peroxidase [Actinomadura sp. K4S16]|uniref:Dyp-type peroxidase n=1 Tax=Actinomadura sp. K4S16 TaxID=1316147 RepID=UPI0011ECD487|nr:Dyp-type peroxidase [Actinomadura sp. K4S16]
MSARNLSRRALFTGGAVVAAGLAATSSCGPDRPAGTRPHDQPPHGIEPFHGPHQAGIATSPQTHAAFVGLDLRPGVDRAGLGRLMRLLTDDAHRLTQGRPGLADAQPELADLPARLTVTFGFGPGLFAAAGLEHQRPSARLPRFDVDRLEDRWSDGDLLVQVCADDAVTLAHAVRFIVKDARDFAAVRWTQRGFRRTAQPPGQTQRNLMGQLDGTVQPADLARSVWISDGPAWLRGGTTMVLRRIRMDLEKWDRADDAAKQFAMGRDIRTGAPLTGEREHDEPDLAAKNGNGFPVIPEEAHIRLARADDPSLRILRRGYNYDEGITREGVVDSGLLFACYQADLDRQFTPVQKRLAASDMLNLWTTPIGSAVFAVPPGCRPGGWIGETLLA